MGRVLVRQKNADADQRSRHGKADRPERERANEGQQGHDQQGVAPMPQERSDHLEPLYVFVRRVRRLSRAVRAADGSGERPTKAVYRKSPIKTAPSAPSRLPAGGMVGL